MNKELILEMCKEIVEGKQNKVTGFKCQGINCEECPISIFNNSTPCNVNTDEDIITTAKKYIAENTEFDWEEFKNGSIVVHCDTLEKAKDFLKECDNHNIKWNGNTKASDFLGICSEGINENCYCCYYSNSKLIYSSLKMHKSEGKTIVKWNIKEEKVVDNKFKVGDKVRCIDDSDGNLCITKGEVYEVEMVHNNWLNVKYNDFHCADYQSFRFELVEEKKTEKTFKEVIADIKEGEVWESNSIAYDIKTIEMYNGSIEIKRRNMDNEIFIRKETLFKLQRKQYTFTEAFKAYEEGKEIESCLSKVRFKIDTVKNDCVYNNKINIFIPIEKEKGLGFEVDEIRGKWYINN